jgi:hypothetical protein
MLILLIIIDHFSWYKTIIKNYNHHKTKTFCWFCFSYLHKSWHVDSVFLTFHYETIISPS